MGPAPFLTTKLSRAVSAGRETKKNQTITPTARSKELTNVSQTEQVKSYIYSITLLFLFVKVTTAKFCYYFPAVPNFYKRQ